jgi:hypothetical protein
MIFISNDAPSHEYKIRIYVHEYVSFFLKNKGLYCSDSLYKNKQRYVQLFLTPIDYCGSHSSHAVVIRTIRRNDGKGREKY